MEYKIIRENNTDFKSIKNSEKIEVPSIPIDIIEILINIFKFMKKFLDYKRDGTLGLLKMNNVVNIYDNNFDLNVKKKVRNWNEFFELIKKYTKIFINEGLKFYRRKEKNELINNFLLINENYLIQ